MSNIHQIKTEQIVEDFLELVREYGNQFGYCEATVDLEDVRRALEKLIKDIA